MNFSWIGDLFGSFKLIFRSLRNIAHWQIWSDIEKLYAWILHVRDWYSKHVLAQMQKMQALERQIFNTWIRPVLSIIDTIRRMTGVVGLFNKALANRLNLMFERVEGYILEPFNLAINKINAMQREFTAFLTPLGFFDRATLLNSLWRDIAHLKQMLWNPWNVPVAGGAATPPPDPGVRLGWVSNYLRGNNSPIGDDVDSSLQYFRNTLDRMPTV